MDFISLIIFGGFIFIGCIVGYPLGHYFGRREAFRELGFIEPKPVRRARRNLEKKNVLYAEYLEVKD